MMIDPPIGAVVAKTDSRFGLVVLCCPPRPSDQCLLQPAR